MKLLAIKIGKAWQTLKREGIFSGGRKIFFFGLSFLKNIISVKPGEILFIIAGVGDSALYRAHNQAEELRMHGFKVSVTMQDNPFLLSLSRKFKIFIFNRTIRTVNTDKLIENIKKQGKEIIFDTDDLVFDAKYIQQTDHYARMSKFEKRQYEKGVGEEIIKDPYVKVCTTSTKFIATILQEYGKRVFVITNKLSNQWLEIAEKLLKNHVDEKENREKIRIGYFSGTIGHNKDFATISDALIRILEKYPQVEIFLAGPLELEKKLDEFSERFVRSFFVPRKKHFENIFYCDIILAPLERDVFSEGKSELKFFEAGLLKVPVVAVRNSTYADVISDGENGFLAESENEWVEKISKLIEDSKFRKNMGEKACKKALQDYTTKNSHGEDYYEYLRLKLK
ncbi:MAG: glycosyltransferase family 4 protein [Candidatus Moranbacteria bacterium]|nr:glycosyltransferase family 4 protein [Candidatus Moranbacteria bacterium]